MKITFFVSGNVRSNFSYRVVALASEMHKLGNDVSIIAPKADKYNDFVPENITDIDGVKIVQPFQFTTRRVEINLFPYLFGAFNALRKERPDLIYIYKPTPISIVGLLGKLFWKTSVIVDIDDLGGEVMKTEGHPYHQRKLVEWSERLAVRYADKIVVASTYLFDMYHREFPEKPIHLTLNGVDHEWLGQPIPSKVSKRIVFLGALNRKSILEPLFDVLPKIIEQIPETQALIMGDGKYLSYFKQKNEHLKLDKNVVFTGWLKLSDARARLHEGDIGYAYMPNETTVVAANNMKVSQYMSRGVVPLVSDIGDLPAMVDFGRVGYIAKTGNLSSLESVLFTALNDGDRPEKAHQTRIFCLKKYNWETSAADLNRWIAPQA